MGMALKHRWSVGHNYLAGITAGAWWRLLRENQFAVDPVYWHRAMFITVSSLLNSFYRRGEERRHGQAVREVEITQPPLFILGHWRSGTTFLHYLLARDSSQFAFANTYQVVNPCTFLCTEEVNTKRFARMVPPTRPMDNMELSFGTPQEDEFAPLLLTFHSPYLGISFPRRAEHYLKYLTFRDVPRTEIEHWQEQFLWFCKKLTLKYKRALLLKSPPHTARIRLLLEMFPEARFVHIHRNPYDVFQSQRHYFDTAMWYTYLQKPDPASVDDGIVSRYTAMYDAYFEDLPLIPADRFCEVRFEDLERDPVGQIRTIYDKLSFTRFEQFQPQLKSYVESLSGYRKNKHAPLDGATRARVRKAWADNFDRWNYPI